MEKSTKDAASAQARAIGATAALSATPIVTNPPTVPIANRVVPSTSGNISGTGTTSSKLVSSPSIVATKTPPTAASKNGRVNMVIQPIPPFKGKKSQSTTQPSNNATQTATKPSGSGPGVQSTKNAEAAKADVAANKLNVNATSFRPNPKAVAFTPVISHRHRPCKLADALPFQASPNTAVGPSANSSPKNKPESVCRLYLCVACRPLISCKYFP